MKHSGEMVVFNAEKMVSGRVHRTVKKQIISMRYPEKSKRSELVDCLWSIKLELLFCFE